MLSVGLTVGDSCNEWCVTPLLRPVEVDVLVGTAMVTATTANFGMILPQYW